MDENPLFRVVFTGEITEEYSLEVTKRRFEQAFKLKKAQVERLFSGAEHTIKKNLSEDDATRFAMKMVELGIECYIDFMPFPDDISLQPGFVERRRGVRRLRFRRGPRPGAVIADRREVPSRRRYDLLMLQREGDFPGSSIKDPKSN